MFFKLYKYFEVFLYIGIKLCYYSIIIGGELMLPYIKIDIKRFIKIEYAHEHCANDYTYTVETEDKSIDGNSNIGVIEIGVVKQNPLIFKNTKGEYVAEEKDIFIIPPKHRFEVSTVNSGAHRHFTTEAIIEFENTEQIGDNTLFLPLIIKADKKSEKIEEDIKRIVSKSSSLHKSNYFEECSDYMRLLSHIKKATEIATEENSASPSSVLYCRSAEKYALDNISRHISIEEIAIHIGISKNYLTNIFSEYKGMPITEYINRMKLNHMLELMRRFDYSATEAGEFIGIDNVNYISRMFKKYYGMTIREYKQIHFG